MLGQRGFWDIEERLKELSAEGDPLEKLNATVDFEMFRPVLRTVHDSRTLRVHLRFWRGSCCPCACGCFWLVDDPVSECVEADAEP